MTPSTATTPEPEAVRAPRAPAPIAPVHAAFSAAFLLATGKRVTLPIPGDPLDRKLHALVIAQGLDEVLARIPLLFGSAEWWAKSKDLATFVQHFDKLVVVPAGRRGGSTTAEILAMGRELEGK